jgi:hypothetical protein
LDWSFWEASILEELKKARIYVSLRYVSGVGRIRTAVHESNSSADVDALLDVTRRFLAKSAKRRNNASRTAHFSGL